MRRADRDSDVRVIAVDLHRVPADLRADRSGRVALPAAGHGGGLRGAASYLLSRTIVPTMARYLLPARRTSWPCTCAARAHRCTEARGGSCPASTSALQQVHLVVRRRVRALSRSATSTSSRGRWRIAVRCSSARRSSCVGVAAARPGDRRGFLPARRRRPVPAARARAVRHAGRGNRDALRQVERRDPAGDPAASSDWCSTTSVSQRTARPGWRRDQRDGWPAGRRHAGDAHRRARSTWDYVRPLRGELAAAVPGCARSSFSRPTW